MAKVDNFFPGPRLYQRLALGIAEVLPQSRVVEGIRNSVSRSVNERRKAALLDAFVQGTPMDFLNAVQSFKKDEYEREKPGLDIRLRARADLNMAEAGFKTLGRKLLVEAFGIDELDAVLDKAREKRPPCSPPDPFREFIKLYLWKGNMPRKISGGDERSEQLLDHFWHLNNVIEDWVDVLVEEPGYYSPAEFDDAKVKLGACVEVFEDFRKENGVRFDDIDSHEPFLTHQGNVKWPLAIMRLLESCTFPSHVVPTLCEEVKARRNQN